MIFELAAIIGGCYLWRRHQKKKRLGARNRSTAYQTYNDPPYDNYNNNYHNGYGGSSYPQPPPYHETMSGSKGGRSPYDNAGYADYRGERPGYEPGNEFGGYGGERRREKGGSVY
jgi:hypothetical protein